MDLYASIVFIHAATILLFFIAHGTSMAVAFKLKNETDPARVRALIELSRFSLGAPAIVFIVLGLLSGVVAGFMGAWWGHLWIWISIVLFVGVGGLMTPLASKRIGQIATAAGVGDAPEDPEEMRRLLGAWNPLSLAALGLTAFLVILWLMYAKPF